MDGSDPWMTRNGALATCTKDELASVAQRRWLLRSQWPRLRRGDETAARRRQDATLCRGTSHPRLPYCESTGSVAGSKDARAAAAPVRAPCALQDEGDGPRDSHFQTLRLCRAATLTSLSSSDVVQKAPAQGKAGSGALPPVSYVKR